MRKQRIAQIDLNIPIAVLSFGVFVWGIMMPMMSRQDDKIERALNGIAAEMRDFHDRLVKIEEARK